MSVYELQRYIFELWSRDEDDMAVTPDDYDLDPDELQLMEDQDLAGLYEVGVHPVLIMQFCRSRGIHTDEIKHKLRQLTPAQGSTPPWRT